MKHSTQVVLNIVHLIPLHSNRFRLDHCSHDYNHDHSYDCSILNSPMSWKLSLCTSEQWLSLQSWHWSHSFQERLSPTEKKNVKSDSNTTCKNKSVFTSVN